jgi:SAM-dependent methyltransferase
MDKRTGNSRVARASDNQLATGHAENVLKVLSAYPGVLEAAVLFDTRDGFIAFVVPNDDYLDDVLGRKNSESMIINRWQKAVDLTQFVKGTAPYPVGLNTQGWNSAYTGQEIPRNEMREWLQVSADEILRLAPKVLYEIGCGTGMLLMQIAPSCDRYAGVDFSPATLAKLREQLQSVPSLAGKVEVIERRADDFGSLDCNSFDTVVMNSVIFYFPNLAYLSDVLEKAINVVKPGGHVYVGDVLSLHLLPVFASSIELFLGDDELSVAGLREQIRRRVKLQPWLFVSPAFFLSLPHRFSKVSRVEIRPRLGRASNEVTGYRFNAIIHVGHSDESALEVAFEDWTERELSLQDIRTMMRQRTEAFGIMRIRNRRLEKDVNAFERIWPADASLTTAEFKHQCAEYVMSGIHPQDLIELSKEESGFEIQLSWAACRPDGSYDAVFSPVRPSQFQSTRRILWPKPEPADLLCFANAPGQEKYRAQLIESILTHCRQNLPLDLVPRDVTLVDMLPRTSN